MNKRKIMSSVVKSINGVTYTPSLVTLEEGDDINSMSLLDTDILDALSIKFALNSKLNVLVDGVNIKTINGESILGEGNIDIESVGAGISDAPSDGKKYVRSNASWVEETKVDTSGFATKEEVTSQIGDIETILDNIIGG